MIFNNNMLDYWANETPIWCCLRLEKIKTKSVGIPEVRHIDDNFLSALFKSQFHFNIGANISERYINSIRTESNRFSQNRSPNWAVDWFTGSHEMLYACYRYLPSAVMRYHCPSQYKWALSIVFTKPFQSYTTITLVILFSTFTDHTQALAIMNAIAYISFKTCIKFAPVQAAPQGNEHVLVFENPEGIRKCVINSGGNSVDEPHVSILGVIMVLGFIRRLSDDDALYSPAFHVCVCYVT